MEAIIIFSIHDIVMHGQNKGRPLKKGIGHFPEKWHGPGFFSFNKSLQRRLKLAFGNHLLGKNVAELQLLTNHLCVNTVGFL
jgi:hypothetical protein